MARKIRLGYDILSKRAIETESGINIDEALKRKGQQIIDLGDRLTNIEGDIVNVLSNFEGIYLDSELGDDDNDGLTKNTAVKTISGAIAAFKNARETNPNLRRLKVFVTTDYQATPLQAPLNEEMASIAGYSDGLYLYGKGIRLANDVVVAPVAIQYPIKIVAENVGLFLNRSSDISDFDLNIECVNFDGYCWNKGSIKIDAANYIQILSNSGAELGGKLPSLKLNCEGTIDLYSSSNYSSVDICCKGDIRSSQSITSTGNVKIRSLEGSLICYSPILAYDPTTTPITYYDVEIDVCYGVKQTASLYCKDLTINAGKEISRNPSDNDVNIAGGDYIYGNAKIKCTNFVPAVGAHQYYGDVYVEADMINLSNAGGFYLHKKAEFISNSYFEGSSGTMYVNNLYVKATGNEPICANSVKRYSTMYSLYPYRENGEVIDKNSSYVFDMGNSDFKFMYSTIQNCFADVKIISDGKVEIGTGSSDSWMKKISIKAKELKLGANVHTGFFEIDVDGMIEQTNPGCYIVMEKQYSSSTDETSYDVQSNNFLKCGSLYCSIYYTSDGSGLIQPYYGDSRKNIDIQVGMILSPYYNGSGCHTPFVLGTCRSGSHTFNSTISGHVGGYVGYSSSMKVSPWNHDVRYIPSSYGSTIVDGDPSSSNNTGGVITLKFDDVHETNHFWFDPNQGDDTLDGCTRQTAVKTVTALVNVIMKKTNGSYNSSYNYFDISQPVSIHILSVQSGDHYGYQKWFNGPGDVYSLSDFMYNDGNLIGLNFDKVDGHSGCRVSFGMLEFIPEAPDMSLYVKACNASVLIAKGFYNVGLCGYGSGSINYIEAIGSVGINNSQYCGGYSYYSNRLGPISIKARDIVLYGWFNCLTAKAENRVVIYDTYGGSSESEGNCCLSGITTIEGAAIDLGVGFEYDSGNDHYETLYKIGINGIAYIKSTGYINCYVDSFAGAVAYIEAADSISGGLGDGFFRGRLHIQCNNCYLGSGTAYGSSYYSFSTYNAANNGGAGIIDIRAREQITAYGWGTNSGNDNYLYGVNLYLTAPLVSGSSSLYIYGNNGSGKILIDADELYMGIRPYYYSYIFVKSQHYTYPLRLYTGGPWTDSGNSTTYVNLDIGKMRSSIEIPTGLNAINTRTYEITGRIGLMNSKVLSWWDTSIDPEHLPMLYRVAYKFSIVVAHSTIEGHGVDKTGWIPDDSGTVIVLNDNKQLVAGKGITISDTGDQIVIAAKNTGSTEMVEIPVILDSLDPTQCSASLVLNKYNVITGLDDSITDMSILVPEPAAHSLREVGFEFTPDSGTCLSGVNFYSENGSPFYDISPEEYFYGCVYQGAVINSCVTLVEYGDPVEPEPEGLVIDGRTYRTVTMPDGNEWMAENLAASSFGGVCYNNGTDDSYGLYYSIEEVAKISVPGWHVATIDEWNGLAASVDSNYAKLASTDEWTAQGTSVTIHGTDDYGFTLCPYGLEQTYLDQSMWFPIGGIAVMWLSNGSQLAAFGMQPNPNTGEFYVQMMTEIPSGWVFLQNVRLVKDK